MLGSHTPAGSPVVLSGLRKDDHKPPSPQPLPGPRPPPRQRQLARAPGTERRGGVLAFGAWEETRAHSQAPRCRPGSDTEESAYSDTSGLLVQHAHSCLCISSGVAFSLSAEQRTPQNGFPFSPRKIHYCLENRLPPRRIRGARLHRNNCAAGPNWVIRSPKSTL